LPRRQFRRAVARIEFGTGSFGDAQRLLVLLVAAVPAPAFEQLVLDPYLV
jgi:hypothetical protein